MSAPLVDATHVELREVLTYGPGSHRFDPRDYPWAVALRGFAQGGHGGAGSGGAPGRSGQVIWFSLQKPAAFDFTVGPGRPGRNGGQKGDDALLVLQLYGRRRSWWCRLLRLGRTSSP